MEQQIAAALAVGGIVDITTTGRRSGEPKRIEIYVHNLDGTLWLTGKPPFPRDWIANLRANPAMTVHLKRGVTADLQARGTVITDPKVKAEVIYRARVEGWKADPEIVKADMDTWVASAPLARVDLID